MPGPAAAAGAKAAGTAAGRVSAGAASRSGTAQAAKRGGATAASRSAKARAGGGSSGGRGGGAGRAGALRRVVSLRLPRRRNEEDEQELFGSSGFRMIAIGSGVLAFFVLVIVAPLALFKASASSCAGEGGEEAVPIQTNHRSDPDDLSETQIAIRIYLVGQVMNMTPRQIVTAFDVAYVESTMTNIHGGDRDSTGVFQQRNFSPWTDGGRNRNNVIDASISFFLQLRKLDHGQAIPVLAQDVQVSAYPGRYYDWVDDAVDTFNQTRRLVGFTVGVKDIQSLQGVTINAAGLDSLSLGAACSGLTATGPANVKQAATLYRPRSYRSLPPSLWAGGGEPEQVDSRVWEDAVWVMSTYHLKATAARETGHHTHGDGTAIDMAPADGNSQRVWDSTARRLALDLGWTSECAANGLSTSAGGSCNFVPAIIFVGYNGYDSRHGDPTHSGSPHIHVSWYSSCYGCGGGALVSPRAWVKAFPVGPESGGPSPLSARATRKGAKT